MSVNPDNHHYTKDYKICNWHLLLSLHYFSTNNAKNKKESNKKMVLICVGEVTLRIKKNHVYNYKYKVGETLIYEREPRNKHSRNAVLWKTKINEDWTCSRSSCFYVFYFNAIMENFTKSAQPYLMNSVKLQKGLGLVRNELRR